MPGSQERATLTDLPINESARRSSAQAADDSLRCRPFASALDTHANLHHPWPW